MLTNHQARQCACPIFGRSDDGHPFKCIASTCMMWRWAEGEPLAAFGDPINILGLEPLEHEQPRDRRGYCGLAGKPEHRE